VIPGVTHSPKEKPWVVVSIDPMPLQTFVIRTFYKSDARPDLVSGYGRGTTPQDLASGDTSLGFHESCHREDYVEYLRTHPLPPFTGQVGMSDKEWDRAKQEYARQFDQYATEMFSFSILNTDKVGLTQDQFDDFTNGFPHLRRLLEAIDRTGGLPGWPIVPTGSGAW
jgi:hypothetical protein